MKWWLCAEMNTEAGLKRMWVFPSDRAPDEEKPCADCELSCGECPFDCDFNVLGGFETELEAVQAQELYWLVERQNNLALWNALIDWGCGESAGRDKALRIGRGLEDGA